MRPTTPRGFRDVLPREAAEREALTRYMTDVMRSWGYGQVETPVVEAYATLETGAGKSVEPTVFRLFDSDGGLLALRPEMTLPIARMVATRMDDERPPFRLCYSADVFREQSSMRGQARQFTQVGLEFLGVSGSAADAEVVAVLVESVRVTGLVDFTVGLGTVAVLRSLIAAAEMPAEWGERVLAAAHARDLVSLDALAATDGVPSTVARALTLVPRTRGGREAIDTVRAGVVACGCEDVLDSLAETWDLLEAMGVTDAVSLDFGIMRSFDYYTGMVLEVYAPGLGLPLGGGGRYDETMARFDAPMPAAGFAVGIERLHIALTEQGVGVAVPPLDCVLGGQPRDAFAAARVLRAAGLSVRLSERTGVDLAGEAASAEAREALIAGPGASLTRLDAQGRDSGPFEIPRLAEEGSS